MFGGVGEDCARANLTESIHVGMLQYADWVVVFRIDRNPETPPRVDRDLLELLGADPHELDHDSAIEGDVIFDHHDPDQPCWDFLTMEHPPPDCEDTGSIEGCKVVSSLQCAWWVGLNDVVGILFVDRGVHQLGGEVGLKPLGVFARRHHQDGFPPG